MRGKANKCRNIRGREYDRGRVLELERLNRAAPVIVYNIYVETPPGRFVAYMPRRRKKRRKEGKER